jgi:prepilin-type N-terminal cleavage/methylation domain-containing protein
VNQKKKRGFTLIEILVSTSIISFLGVVIYATFYQGLNIWSRALNQDPVIDVDIFLDRLGGELSHAFQYTSPALVGQKDSVTFYSLARAVDGEGHRLPVKVTYEFQPEESQVLRQEKQYGEILYPSGQSAQSGRPMIDKIAALKFRYYAVDETTRQYRWLDYWRAECMPDAIQVQLTYGGTSRKEISKIFPFRSHTCSTRLKK